MELGGEDVAVAESRIDARPPYEHVAAITAGSSGTACSEWTKYTHASSERPANIGSSAIVRVNRFHCICGRGSSVPSHRIVPGITPSPRAESSSSLLSNSICMPTQMPRKGRPESTASSTAILEIGVAQCRHARAERADAGQHDCVRIGDQTVVDGQSGIGAATLQRLLRRAQIADAVVEHGDQRLQSLIVLQHALRRRHLRALDAHCVAKAPRQTFEHRLDDVMHVAAATQGDVQA